LTGTVVVTGGASGIGRATVDLLRAAGRRVAVWDIAMSGDPVVDVTDEASVAAAWQRVCAEGHVDGVVNAAGIFAQGHLGELTLELWEHVLRVNVTSAFLVCRSAFEHLRDQGGGSIVNVGSIAATQAPLTACSAYAASKGALLSFTRALAREGAPHGIRANCVSPSAIDTPLLRAPLSPEQLAAYESRSPAGRFGTAEEVAGAIVYLLSPAASFVSGANLEVTGG
jgi:2-keto-3-deoxy-L-fuconate dehydrogenase